jgi:addiction module HigA family antidote
MAPIVHPGRLLKRELAARKLSANRLALDIGVPSGRITGIDTAVRLGRYFGNSAQFWLDLQTQYEIGVVEREKGAEIARRVRPTDAAWAVWPDRSQPGRPNAVAGIALDPNRSGKSLRPFGAARRTGYPHALGLLVL